MERIIIVPTSLLGGFSAVMCIQSSEPFLAHTKCSISAVILLSGYCYYYYPFHSWGSEERTNLSQGIGKGRGGAQDLNPGPLTPEHHAGCQVLSVGAGEQLEPLRAASDSRR